MLATQATAARNGVSINVFECTYDSPPFFAQLATSLLGSIDILLFNPPYVPTPSAEVGRKDISAAWAGGLFGREVIDRFMLVAESMLSTTGRLYVIALEANLRTASGSMLTAWPNLNARIVMTRQAGIELLHVICYTLRPL